MTVDQIMTELKSLGHDTTRRTHMRHGAREPLDGVKVEDLKKIQKRIKKSHDLALALFATGHSDAMYLAGLIAEPPRMTPDLLHRWAEQATWYMLSEYTVAGVAAESPNGWEVASAWIESDRESIASAGWATLANIVSITPDDRLDTDELAALLERVQTRIATAPNRVRYTMNGFLIAVGTYVPALTSKAIETARQIGPVRVDMGDTACKVPFAPDYIQKAADRDTLGRKRKSPRC